MFAVQPRKEDYDTHRQANPRFHNKKGNYN